MPEIMRVLPKQTIAVVAAGAGVGVMKWYGQLLARSLNKLEHQDFGFQDRRQQ